MAPLPVSYTHLSTTQLIFSRLTVENRANAYAVPDFTIGDREILYRSPIHFTPLLSATRLDAAGIRCALSDNPDAAARTAAAHAVYDSGLLDTSRCV